MEQRKSEQLVQAVIDANRDRLSVMLAPHATVDLVQIERDYLLNLVSALAESYPEVTEYLVMRERIIREDIDRIVDITCGLQ
jgi:hypothetical protein